MQSGACPTSYPVTHVELFILTLRRFLERDGKNIVESVSFFRVLPEKRLVSTTHRSIGSRRLTVSNKQSHQQRYPSWVGVSKRTEGLPILLLISRSRHYVSCMPVDTSVTGTLREGPANRAMDLALCAFKGQCCHLYIRRRGIVEIWCFGAMVAHAAGGCFLTAPVTSAGG